MPLAAETQMQHIGSTSAMSDHDRDIVHELNKRLDSVWRYDQYIANADGHPDLQDFWRQLKSQDHENVGRLRDLLKSEIEKGCF
jgi:protoheme ferro-lyase